MSLIKSAPNISLDEAVALANQWYNIHTTATSLPSERDQNFKLSTFGNVHYILKISNVQESEEFLRAQNETMSWVLDNYGETPARQKDFNERIVLNRRRRTTVCQVPMPNIHGSAVSTIDLRGKRHFFRLITWLDGVPLAMLKERPASLLFELGQVMGKIDLTLLHFDHPAVHRDFHWDVANGIREIQKFKHEIRDPEKKKLVERLFVRLEPNWAAQTANLRKSVIHSDANDYNVIVTDEDCSNVSISGILDWGDMVYSYLVCEPVIAAAYGLLDKTDLLDAISQVVTGYHSVYPLFDKELEAIFNLVCARLCMSVCHSAHQAAARPGDDYLSISEEPAWNALAKLELIDPDVAYQALLSACGSPMFSGHQAELTENTST
jgi:Ser/Thr protein kinase RdoA (MazF antagonist)